jgi:uncharacterized protein (DUF1800 family)
MSARASRRDVLRLAAAIGIAPLVGCDRIVDVAARSQGEAIPETLDAPLGRTIDPVHALLSRAAFGPWPGDVERVRALGRNAWIDEQLRPDAIEDRACDLRARRFESVFCDAGTAWEFEPAILRRELAQHALLRAVYSRRQLKEVMVELWTDHFNIDLGKGDCIYLKPTDDRTVIRANALGRFRDLVRASATSGAMLVYLDGAASTGGAPNENYARELLELHTLGVHGGYTQADVREVARCMTGWTVKCDGFGRGRVAFDPARHDDGPKQVLGVRIPAGLGASDVDRVVDIVSAHPSTATHVADKLARRFVADEPDPALVRLVARAFTESEGDIAATVRALLLSDPFQEARATKVKRPFRLVASALRALGADTTAGDDVLEQLGRMGQAPFAHPTPDGYPDRADAWTGALLFRIDFGVALARGEIASAKVDLPALRRALGTRSALFGHLVGRAPTTDEARALADVGADDLVGVLLASPAFQRC